MGAKNTCWARREMTGRNVHVSVISFQIPAFDISRCSRSSWMRPRNSSRTSCHVNRRRAFLSSSLTGDEDVRTCSRASTYFSSRVRNSSAIALCRESRDCSIRTHVSMFSVSTHQSTTHPCNATPIRHAAVRTLLTLLGHLCVRLRVAARRTLLHQRVRHHRFNSGRQQVTFLSTRAR